MNRLLKRAARLAALAVTFAPLAACSGASSTGPAAGPGGDAALSAEPIRVRTARAAASGDGWVETPGTIEAVESADVASRVAAIVERVLVEEGDAVRRGQLLVRLDGRDVQAKAKAAEAEAGAARSHRDRIRSLFDKEAATRQELEQAERDDEAAAAAVEAARAQLDYVILRAPFDGRVVGKMAAAGDLALPGRALLAVQGSGALRAVSSLSEDQMRGLSIGQNVAVVLDDGTRLTARVSVMSPASDPVSRRFLVKCDLPAATTARAGSFARLRLQGGPPDAPGVVAPKRALIERGALTGVFVVEEGRARLRWISPGEADSDRVRVRAGLSAGEEIVIDPAGLTDGAAVRTEPAELAP